MPKLSASLENYLEIILTLKEESEDIKAVAISKRLGVSKASVTEALRALCARELINYTPYGVITLTAKGTERARKIVRKHEALYDFLANILGVDNEEALETACKIEHVISENVLDRLLEFIQKQEK